MNAMAGTEEAVWLARLATPSAWIKKIYKPNTVTQFWTGGLIVPLISAALHLEAAHLQPRHSYVSGIWGRWNSHLKTFKFHIQSHSMKIWFFWAHG